MTMDAKKLFKIVAGVAATIFLGALGSGLWQTIISPFMDYISRSSIDFISSIYSGFLDSVYLNASIDVPNLYMRKVAFLITSIVGIYLLVVSMKDIIVRHARVYIRPYTAFIGGLIFVISYFGFISSNYAQQIQSYSYRSMEILRPFVGESTYYHLRSQYFRIEGVNSFNDFNRNLVAFSKEHSVELPKFELIK